VLEGDCCYGYFLCLLYLLVLFFSVTFGYIDTFRKSVAYVVSVTRVADALEPCAVTFYKQPRPVI
jgi:hypothetical protein